MNGCFVLLIVSGLIGFIIGISWGYVKGYKECVKQEKKE